MCTINNFFPYFCSCLVKKNLQMFNSTQIFSPKISVFQQQKGSDVNNIQFSGELINQFFCFLQDFRDQRHNFWRCGQKLQKLCALVSATSVSFKVINVKILKHNINNNHWMGDRLEPPGAVSYCSHMRALFSVSTCRSQVRIQTAVWFTKGICHKTESKSHVQNELICCGDP